MDTAAKTIPHARLREVALSVAPNGGTKTKKDHPRIPLTADELAVTAAACREAGAAMIHMHVRDGAAKHSLDAGRYLDAIARVKAAVGDRIIVQITSEALGRFHAEEQIAAVKAVRPEAVSLALREFASSADEETRFASFLQWLKQERIFPQIILYSPEEVERLGDMLQRGVVPWQDIPVLYVLGRYASGQTSSPHDLVPFLKSSSATRFTNWTICAFGLEEANCIGTAILLGGHGRVGFENNLYRPDGSLAYDNHDLVAVSAEFAGRAGYRLMDAQNQRDLWTKMLEF